MADFTVYPDNHLYVVCVVKIPDDDDPREFLLYDDLMGPAPEGFLSEDEDHAATAADASWAEDLIYSGIPGIWFFKLLATVLTYTLLNSKFASTPPKLLVIVPNASREVSTGAFDPIRRTK